MCQSLREAARQLQIPRHHEALLCDLNGIEDAERDLRLSHRREFLLLPPEDIVKSKSTYCLMRKGEKLRDVLGRQGIRPSLGALESRDEWWAAFRRANPWAGGLGLDKPQVDIELQYVLLPPGGPGGVGSSLKPIIASRSA
jgi:hypothetical protein